MPRKPLNDADMNQMDRDLVTIKRTLDAGGSDLVSAWIAAMRPCNEPLTALLDDLARQTGTKYSLSRLGEWRNGRRTVPDQVQRVMRRDLCRYWFDDELGDMIADRLETTELTPGA